MSGYADILPILQTMAAVICLGGALLLLLRGRDSRSRRMLAAVMSIWGLIYAMRVAGTLMGNSDLNFTNTDAADTLVLVAGNFFLIVLLLYPLEVVRPAQSETGGIAAASLCRTVAALLRRPASARPRAADAARYGPVHGTYR